MSHKFAKKDISLGDLAVVSTARFRQKSDEIASRKDTEHSKKSLKKQAF